MSSPVPRDPSLNPEIRKFLDGLSRRTSVFDNLTATEATALLDIFTTTLQGLVPAGGSDATKVLHADASWSAPCILQCLQTTYTSNADLTTALPIDDSIPAVTEGAEVLSLAITPHSASNKILCLVELYGGTTAVELAAMALFRGSTCINAAIWAQVGANGSEDGSMNYLDSPATTSSTTYSVRVGTHAGGVVRLNGINTARRFGGASACTLTLMEIAG